MYSFAQGDGTKEANAWNEATDEERAGMGRRYQYIVVTGQTQYEADLEASHNAVEREAYIRYDR